MRVVVVVNIEAKKGRSTEALEIMEKSQEFCLSVDSCSGFEILQCQDDDHKFSFIERWSSTEAHKAFLEQRRLH